jgi:hypothetical protein
MVVSFWNYWELKTGRLIKTVNSKVSKEFDIALVDMEKYWIVCLKSELIYEETSNI